MKNKRVVFEKEITKDIEEERKKKKRENKYLGVPLARELRYHLSCPIKVKLKKKKRKHKRDSGTTVVDKKDLGPFWSSPTLRGFFPVQSS